MKYKLKEEYKGLIVTRNHMRLGKVTFDSNSVDPENYENFHKLGFEELFEEILETLIEVVVDAIVDKVEDIKAKRKTKRKL